MKTIFAKSAPVPAGHYSHATVHNDTVYVSGQLPIDPVSGEKKTGAIEEQVEQVLKNIAEILRAAGSDMSLWERLNAVYARFFGEHRPARTVAPAPNLHYGFQVELDAIAAIKKK